MAESTRINASAIRMRDAGRSWSEIAEALNISVNDARAYVEETKQKRRTKLADTPENEWRLGLLDECFHCKHLCRNHTDDDQCPTCGPERRVYLVHDSRSGSTLITEHTAAPERPEDATDDSWWCSSAPVHRGCPGFQTKAEWQAANPVDPQKISRGRFPNDLNLEGYKLGVLGRDSFGRRSNAPTRALESTVGGPSTKSLVRRARRAVARKERAGRNGN